MEEVFQPEGRRFVGVFAQRLDGAILKRLEKPFDNALSAVRMKRIERVRNAFRAVNPNLRVVFSDVGGRRERLGVRAEKTNVVEIADAIRRDPDKIVALRFVKKLRRAFDDD